MNAPCQSGAALAAAAGGRVRSRRSVSTLKEETGPGAEGAGPDQAVTGPAPVPGWRRWRDARPGPAGLGRGLLVLASALAVAGRPSECIFVGVPPLCMVRLHTP